MIITKENDTGIEIYTLVNLGDGWYWTIEIKPYDKQGRKSGLSRKFKSQSAAMKAVGKKIVEMENDGDVD